MFRNIPSATLRKLVALSERKEALMARVQDIEHEMVQIQQGIEAAAGRDLASAQLRVSRPAEKRTRRQQTARGELKNKVLTALSAAGKRGLTIGDLSDKLGVKRANLYVWFNGTGRNVRGIRKIGPAKYQLRRR